MKRGFTLIEIIIVIIIVGILAAVGLNQYSLTVEKSRLAEAKKRLGIMRQLVYEYWLNNGTLTGITDSDIGVNNTCTSEAFYRYRVAGVTVQAAYLEAYRCIGGSGKAPSASRQYLFYITYNPSTGGGSSWRCYYTDDSSSCFGYP